MQNAPLIARDAEAARLHAALERATAGEGSLVLLSGDAGIGKTALTAALADAADVTVLRGAAAQTRTEPHGPLVAALRSYLHAVPDGLDDCGPLRSHLAVVLPELGEQAADGDRATLFEAFRCAVVTISRRGPVLIVLDDLHWSDEATLDLLAALGGSLSELPVLVVAAYRSDELPRGHALRRLRTELRRAGALDELQLAPLDRDGSAAVAERVVGAPLSPALAAVVHDRTQGVPFFVEELSAALVAGGLTRSGEQGVELAEGGALPVPATVRDAVLLRAARLPEDARAAAEVAAVAGERFDLDAVAEIAGQAGLLELVESGLVEETGAGRAAFHHALVRDALYEDVAWLRRRTLHEQLAAELARRDAPPAELATHWLAARDDEKARAELLRAADAFAAAHAYRDAARAGHQALELWPDSDGAGRVTALERYALCSELAGDLSAAARAWRETAGLHEDVQRPAAAQRHLARVYELQGDRKRAVAAHLAAADGFAAASRPADAAAARLAAATHLQSAGDHARGSALANLAAAEAQQAGRIDLRSRALGVEGVALAKRGQADDGLERIRAGLSLALEHELTGVAAEVYQRLGTALETRADYAGARDALNRALDLCAVGGDSGQEQGCVACMAYVLREMGEWDEAAALCRRLLDDPVLPDGTRIVAEGILGAILAWRGDSAAARPLLESGLNLSRSLNVLSMSVDCAAALAWLEAEEGAAEAAAEHCRFVLDRWERSEDVHYSVWGLRFAATQFAAMGDANSARGCADALTRIATESGSAYALAALAAALGEAALVDGDADTAADQLARAAGAHKDLSVPSERAQIATRAAAALLAAGQREPAVQHLADACRVARRLGARPIASRAAAELAALGESIEQRVGRRAAAEHDGAGLTRRELEVMRLVAVGRTNREIASTLYLSPRTVDMHVRNILGKLGCRSRVEATTKAHSLGLMG
jgi:DNA-binding NarL/FixJ family response regulator